MPTIIHLSIIVRYVSSYLWDSPFFMCGRDREKCGIRLESRPTGLARHRCQAIVRGPGAKPPAFAAVKGFVPVKLKAVS